MRQLILNYLQNEGIEIPSDFEKLDICDLEEMHNIIYDQIDQCYIDTDISAYCEIEDIITHSDNVIFCDYSNLYFTELNYRLVDVIGRRLQISNYYIYSNGLHEYGLVELHNQDISPLDQARFVSTEGEYYHEDDCYYWESDGEYHLEEEGQEEDEGDYNFQYHGSNPEMLAEYNEPKVGFEVEKEDEDIKTRFRAQYLKNRTGWGKENDGSLNSQSGFELVSPVYPLHGSKEYFLSEFEKVKELLNADYSNESCGGHINYSNPNFGQIELLNAVKGYLPLLYALYPHRINKNYCKAKHPNDLVNQMEKYQSVCIKRNCIEFRIFGAVKSDRNLMWRLELIQIMDLYKSEKPSTILLYMSDESHPLYTHLTKIYNHERLMVLINRFEKYAKQFHNVYLDNRLLNEIDNRLTMKVIKSNTKLY